MGLYEHLKSHSSANVIPISTHKVLPQGISVRDGILHDGSIRIDLHPFTRLKGNHNWQNTAAAYAAAKALGLELDQIIKGIETFPGLEHRQQMVKSWQGHHFRQRQQGHQCGGRSPSIVSLSRQYRLLALRRPR